MKYGYFDDLNKEYVIETREYAASMDKLSWNKRIFLINFKHLRRLLLLQGRKAQKNSEIPIQQYPCG